MGCSQSTEANDPSLNQKYPAINRKASQSKLHQNQNINHNFLITMIGNTHVSALILGFNKNAFQPILSKMPIPRYCTSILHDSTLGYITGGIEDLQANINIKATLDFQIFQGVISKKFIKVTMQKLLIEPETSFELMPQMINSRYAHCAIEAHGCLYALGGRQYGGDEMGLLSACEKFDFNSKKWKSIPSLQYPRSAATSLVYGEHIYMFGGYTGNKTRTRVIESYGDGDSSWRKLSFQLHEGFEGQLALKKPNSDNTVLILGGKTNYEKSNRIVEINFDKSTIQYLPSMIEKRSFHKGTAIDNQIFIIGGGTQYIERYKLDENTSQINSDLSYLQFCSMKELNAFSQFQEQIILKYKKKVYQSPLFENKVYMYGHSHQPFSKIINTDNLIVVSAGQDLHHNFHQFSNVIKVNKENSFVLGGINSDFSQVTNVVYSFNMKTEEIRYLQPMIMARYAFSSTVLGSYLYIIGGRRLGDDELAILNNCQRFSFESYKWEPIASMKHKRQSSTVVIANGYIVVFGGYKGNGVRANQIQVYIEHQNRWVELDSLFELSIESMTAVTFQNTIYLFGGRADQTEIQKVFKLTLEVDEGLKYEKFIRVEIEPVGNLSYPGSNLRVFLSNTGMAYIFGNISHGIDVYDIRANKVNQILQLPIFQKLKDNLFQSYTLIY